MWRGHPSAMIGTYLLCLPISTSLVRLLEHVPFKSRPMNRLRICCLLALPLLLTTCRPDTPTFLFEYPLPDQQLEIPAGLNVFGQYYFNFDPVPTFIDGLLSSHQIDTAAIKAIVPGQARLVAVYPDGDFSFIARVSLRLCRTGDGTDKCGIEVFWRDPTPEQPSATLDLVPHSVNVKDYLLDDQVRLQLILEQLRDISPAVEARLQVEFRVE